MKLDIDVASIKSEGHLNNEDSYFIGKDYMIVADGMGGESDGDIASKIAVETISSLLEENLKRFTSEQEVMALLVDSIKRADEKISDYISQNPDSFGMGTTVVIAVKKENELYVCWCGDSRCYVFSEGNLKPITKDHSFVQELIDAGEITEKESFTHPDNNLITRYVGGGESDCIPDFVSCKISDSDILVLCSDGLCGYCDNKSIEDLIAKNPNNKRMSNDLLDLALLHGSDDDITVLTTPLPFENVKNQSFFDNLKRMLVR